MNEPDSPSAEQSLFEAAVGKASEEERQAFLQDACRDNPGERARLELLLEGHFRAEGFMGAVHKKADEAPPPIRMGEQAASRLIGRYKLLQKIGEGGFGEVWMAEQREPVKRWVALKIIKLGMDTKQVVARFEAERQALALMDHPNIAKVFDGGATDTGRPYFVMELVRGTRITDYCDQHRLSTHERLTLFMQVCQAIQHAHQKGVIHRDIKPTNVLVTLHDGVPVPKVIDFGIAKATQQELTEKTVFTEFRQFLGTPAYVSPEQAEMSGLDIDTRADIYSLGVLLYELLTGKTPFDASTLMAVALDELRRIIKDTEPLRPSTRLASLGEDEMTSAAHCRDVDATKLLSLLKGDLDWIAMKCLEKDRNRRYETANGLAMDISRYLNSEPVLARPPSFSYHLWKLIHRNKLSFAAAGAVLLALIFAVGFSSWMFARERKARLDAVAAEKGQALLRHQAELARTNEMRLRVLTGSEMNAIGVEFSAEGRFDVAERVLRRAFGLHKELLGNSDGNTVMAAGNLMMTLNRVGRTQDAESVLGELLPASIETQPDSFGLLIFRAQYRVHCWHLEAAANDMAKALFIRDDDGLEWLRLASILLENDNTSAYDDLRKRMLDRFEQSPDYRLREVTAKSCLLLPWSGEELEKACQCAEFAVEASPEDQWTALARGLSDYRQGHYTSAIDWERRSLKTKDVDAVTAVTSFAIIAMAEMKNQNVVQAEDALNKAITNAPEAVFFPIDPTALFDENWHNILVARLFLREAMKSFPVMLNTSQDSEREALNYEFRTALLTWPMILSDRAAACAELGNPSTATNMQLFAIAAARDPFQRSELTNGLAFLCSIANRPGLSRRSQTNIFSDIYCYDGGYFAKINGVSLGGSWREGKSDFSKSYGFEEVANAGTKIILQDRERSLTIQIPTEGGMSQVSTDGGKTWSNLYAVDKSAIRE